jgi:hypothetical protein
MYVHYNNNTHAMLEVNTSLELPMQGLHSESLWTGMLFGATSRSDTYDSMQSTTTLFHKDSYFWPLSAFHKDS